MAESTRQAQPTPGSGTLRADQEGLAFAGLAETTQIRRSSPRRDTLDPEVGFEKTPAGEKEDRRPKVGTPTGDLGERERRVALLRDHVSALRRERDRIEATMLNQHIYRASTRCTSEDALEDLREATQEEYAQLLEREVQPTLEYFELIDEELINSVPLEEEEDPNFDYPGDYDWKEGDYMWLLFKIQQHFIHREIWNGVYGFIGRTQPQRKAKNHQALIELTETWQDLFDKAIRVKKRARRYLDEKREGSLSVYEDAQPPPDALVPPNVPTIERSKRASGAGTPRNSGRVERGLRARLLESRPEQTPRRQQWRRSEG